MRIAVKVVSFAALVGLGVWLWIFLHPSPEEVIRARFAEIARTVSVAPKDGNLSRMAAASGLADSFTRDADILVENPRGGGRLDFKGRDDIFEKARAVVAFVKGMKVEFLDLNILVGPNKQTAEVELTAKITFTDNKDIVPQEMKCLLKRIDGEWLIARVETVRVLN